MAPQLPPCSSLSPYALEFLNSNLSSEVDLAGGAALLSELRDQSDDLARSISELNTELLGHLARHFSNSERVASVFSSVRGQLEDLRRISGGRLWDPESSGGMWVKLEAMAKEVARVDIVRNYAETALKLDMLVADVEDAVTSSRTVTLRKLQSKNEDKIAVALRALKLTEDVLASVVKQNPQWSRLISAVDHRIDRALAILRPQAIADHRALLSSLGWPPSVSNLNSSYSETRASADAQNPLFTMQGDLKIRYCENFLALCGLQELQIRRKYRQLQGHSVNVPLHEPLWVIEELVNPIITASQHHFSKWINNPEYIFALVYKITLDYVGSMDDLLQPYIDESMLSGYSCREEWISAMVSSLATHFSKEVFPVYVNNLSDAGNAHSRNQARMSLLNLLDLMIEFDKRFQSLAAQSGVIPSGMEYSNLEKISSLSIFCDRPDWLDLWAEVELAEALDKLIPEMEDERNWIGTPPQVSQLPDELENKCPIISTAVIRCLNSVIDHCRALPSVSLRSRFVQLTVGPIINKFLDCLLQRCLEAEGLTALTDDTSLIKVSQSVNTVHHVEAVLKEFSEDIFFLEMVSDRHASETVDADGSKIQLSSQGPESNILCEEIEKLQGFRTEWVEKFSTVILRGFDALCRDYIKNKKQWQEKCDEALSLSRSFAQAMDYLHKKLSVVQDGLNKMDFTRVWRSVAAAVDKFFFSSILIGNVKFHDGGVERLGSDLALLFGVFATWCMRPEGFFPKIAESLKLLRMEKQLLQSNSVDDERWLRDNGIKHLGVLEVQKVVKSRIFSS